jgi:hypothetical protein
MPALTCEQFKHLADNVDVEDLTPEQGKALFLHWDGCLRCQELTAEAVAKAPPDPVREAQVREIARAHRRHMGYA